MFRRPMPSVKESNTLRIWRRGKCHQPTIHNEIQEWLRQHTMTSALATSSRPPGRLEQSFPPLSPQAKADTTCNNVGLVRFKTLDLPSSYPQNQSFVVSEKRTMH